MARKEIECLKSESEEALEKKDKQVCLCCVNESLASHRHCLSLVVILANVMST